MASRKKRPKPDCHVRLDGGKQPCKKGKRGDSSQFVGNKVCGRNRGRIYLKKKKMTKNKKDEEKRK